MSVAPESKFIFFSPFLNDQDYTYDRIKFLAYFKHSNRELNYVTYIEHYNAQNNHTERHK